jgi:hypothetical protein
MGSSRLPQAYPGVPEARGPGTETADGGLSFGQPGPTCGPMPLPTAEEREAAAALPEQCISCDGLPAALLQRLAGLAQRAGLPLAGCWWCRHIPADVLASLQQLAQSKTGAAR